MKKIKIGLAGLGCVGKGFYQIIKKDEKLISAACKSEVEIIAVSARTKKDFVDAKIKFYENAVDMARDPEIDVIVELIGGKNIAKDLIIAAIKNNKKIITANKALLAEDGVEIAKILEENNGHIGFEASCAAAIPIIKIFKESFAANKIKEFYAILNGTCNFILSKMAAEEKSYAEVLKEAQDLGYAESDPTFDVKGIDSAHKLVILSAIAAKTKPNFAETFVEGIDKITAQDINLAQILGYKIKLLAVYKASDDAAFQAVYPCLILAEEKIAQVDSSFNAILTLTENANHSFVVGRGAGSIETGSAVVSDLIDIARGDNDNFIFSASVNDLKDAKIQNINERFGQYFISLLLNKELSKEPNLYEKLFAKIAIKQAHMIDSPEHILCAFITENIKEKELVEILANIDQNLASEVKFLRVEKTNF